MTENPAPKKWFSKSNIGNVLFFAAILTILFVPGARSLVTRGLMAVGFFQPKTEQAVKLTAVPDVAFNDATGRSVNLSSLKGKVVFINFWATWCPPCLAELPSIDALHQKLSANPGIVFLMVDVDNQLNKSMPFIKDHGYNLPVYGVASDIPSELVGQSIPTTVVIDKKGEMVFHHEGVADYSGDKFEQYLLKLESQ
ncbi:TlpA family protein disulfide reductase [Mucilaginibacter glaciei]|uniref:TlpA family protein disulfide reductase n=1 Tax=Mucilaginibacter glaciei TaxID=2772109 RepID=A0A926S0Y8_9SPHI|nr:TlpA disulfide reductase family protein [Mucilaginibacter glaciei]MBD1391614.1 TlpA family protein disulfide reductase [Mucilaginibacter glaciei]